MVAATTAGLKYSSNGGTSWSGSNVGGGTFWGVYTADGTTFYAGRSDGAIFKSNDGGANFTSVASGFGLTAAESIYVGSTGAVYAAGTGASSSARIYKSTDGGVTFSLLVTKASEGGAWVVKKIGTTLFFGTNAGLYKSLDDGATTTSYCNSACTNTGTLPSNLVQDLVLANNTLYVATDVGIGVNPGYDFTTWENYTATELGGGNVNITGITFANGKLYQSVLTPADDPIRSTNSRGNGLAMPTSNQPYVPFGGGTSPLATSITVYEDPGCNTPGREYFFPNGIGGSGQPAGSVTTKTGAGGNTRVFLNDL